MITLNKQSSTVSGQFKTLFTGFVIQLTSEKSEIGLKLNCIITNFKKKAFVSMAA
jgi:hypothetical protein